MLERLQKILSARGVASRRKAEELILKGLVSVNGRIASLGDLADPDTDAIAVEGKSLPSTQASVYIMLNKPRGYVTTLSDEKGRPTAASLVKACGVRVYPVGRLDMDSEGLLLFTNDGTFANEMMHPKHEIEKTYLVTVRRFSEDGFSRLKQPIILDGYRLRPPKLQLFSSTGDQAVFEIVIHEGRNRQIRRMCEYVGMQVIRLKRIKEGHLELGDLPSGEWKYLSETDLKKI